MTVKKGHIIELPIEKTAFGGQGVGRIDGLVVFVKGAVPGDTVRATVFRKKKDYAEARLVELLNPSPDRVDAPCRYAGHCGGCQWQHVRYEKQLDYKRAHVKEALEHIGGLQDTKVHEVIPSEDLFAYRNKMEFSFSDRRWYLPEELPTADRKDGFCLGLHVPGTYHKVIDVEECLLQKAAGNEILRLAKGLARESGIPPYGLKSHVGFWRYLVVRHSLAHDEWMVNVVTSEHNGPVLQQLDAALRRHIPKIGTVINNINSRRASIAVGENEVVLSGRGFIQDKIGPFQFQVSANSFFQTNSRAAEILYHKVLEYAEPRGDESLMDLYSGTGTIPIFLSAHVASVTGLEISESAVLDARKNCENNRIGNCEFLCGDIRKVLMSVHGRPDILVIDPPRAGMHKDVLSQVLSLAPRKIVYVSCNPATLSRDVAGLTDDYELLEVQPVDMFPHTYHIEAVAALRRRKRA